MNFKSFQNTLMGYVPNIQYQKQDYLNNQVCRYFETYQVMKPYLKDGKKILSIGGGSCYLEAFIKGNHNVEVDVIDFSEVLTKNEKHYQTHNINTHGCNFVDGEITLPLEKYDFIFSLEVIEHVKEAPSVHFKKFFPFCKSDCNYFVSTPNVGNFTNILSMIIGRPFQASPELTFSPTSKQNEFIHRREYFAKEMERSLELINIKTEKVSFIRKKIPSGVKDRIKAIVHVFVPRLRPIFLITAKRSA